MYVDKRIDKTIAFPISFSTILGIIGMPVVNNQNDSGRGLENIKTFNTHEFTYRSGYDISNKNIFWLSCGV